MVHVTAAILIKEGRILAARRRDGVHLAGYWEFPGGKIEEGESPETCLSRELDEEFGIECTVDNFFAESIYDYGSKVVQLLSYFVTHNRGEFQLRDHDKIVWLAPEELESIEWAPADVPLVKKLLLRL
jgi:mutator protein MutT